MARILRFVDPALTSTVRLDLADPDGIDHDEETFTLGDSPVRKVKLSNASTDGEEVVASALDNALVQLSAFIHPQETFAAAVSLLEALRTELRRTTNAIEFRPNGAAASWIFDTYHADSLPTIFRGGIIQPDYIHRLEKPGEQGYFVESIPLVIERHPVARGAGVIL